MITKQQAEAAEQDIIAHQSQRSGEVPGGYDTLKKEAQRGRKLWLKHHPEDDGDEGTDLENLIDGMDNG